MLFKALLLSKPSEVPYGELIPTQIITASYDELYSKKKRERTQVAGARRIK
jgi:hypothetical protein